MFITYGLSAEDIELINKTYRELDNYFSIKIEAEPLVNIKLFEIAKYYRSVEPREFIRIKEGLERSFVVYNEVEYKIAPSKYSHNVYREVQLWGGAFLSKDYAHIIITPETFEDKLREMFTPMELDFDDDENFSSQYYLLTKDKAKAKRAITSSFREILKKSGLKDFYLEIKNDILLIGNKKKPGNEAPLLASFVFSVSELRL
jgi:hypothetical protein